METTVVGIASVESKPINTKRGPSTVYTITDALGIDYTTFDRDIAVAAGALKGRNALISFNFKQNTKSDSTGAMRTYTNRYLESVENSAEDIGPIGVQSNKSVVLGSAPESRVVFDKDQSIARAVALKAAVELAVGAGEPLDIDVLAVADSFVPWLLGADVPTKTSVGVDAPVGVFDDGIPF